MTTHIIGGTLDVEGASKTLGRQLIAGFLSPDTGEIFLDGRPITSTPPHRRRIGLVSQDGALFPHLSVARNIAFGLSASEKDRSGRSERVAELLELVSLPVDYGPAGLMSSQAGSGSGWRWPGLWHAGRT